MIIRRSKRYDNIIGLANRSLGVMKKGGSRHSEHDVHVDHLPRVSDFLSYKQSVSRTSPKLPARHGFKGKHFTLSVCCSLVAQSKSSVRHKYHYRRRPHPVIRLGFRSSYDLISMVDVCTRTRRTGHVCCPDSSSLHPCCISTLSMFHLSSPPQSICPVALDEYHRTRTLSPCDRS